MRTMQTRHRERGSCVWGPAVSLAGHPRKGWCQELQTLEGETLNSLGLVCPFVLSCYWRDVKEAKEITIP